MTDLSPETLHVCSKALLIRLLEAESLLDGGHTSEPEQHDTCCEYHLENWKARDEVQRAYVRQRDAIEEALRAVNAALRAANAALSEAKEER